MLVMVDTRVLGFEHLKELYANDSDFAKELTQPSRNFHIHDEFLFKHNKLCIPQSGACELLIREAHSGAMAGHFEVHKTFDMLDEYFYWPKMINY